MSRRLEGKVAIVTDAGSGIGEALAKRGRTPFAHKFAQEGAKVVVNGLPDVPVQKVAEASNKYGGEAIASTGDVSEPSHAQAGFNGVSQNSPYGGTKGQMHSFIKGVANNTCKRLARKEGLGKKNAHAGWTINLLQHFWL